MAPPPNPFEALELDRAAERREQRDWLEQAWPSGRVVEVDFEGRSALDDRGGLGFRSGGEISASLPERACFLGLAEGRAYFALPGLHAAPDRPEPVGLREAASRLTPFDAGLFAYAKALLLWHTRAAFCGACGSATESIRAGHCRRCRNPDCGLEHYPRTDAAVIVLVRDGQRALIGRSPGWPERRYSTLAGFVEPGESLEDALRREVFEESGVRVGVCRYHSSQPWPFPASLMVGYHADALDPSIQLGEELADARWVGAAQLLDEVRRRETLLPFRVSISYRLIFDWLVEQLGRETVLEVTPEPGLRGPG
ncbi:NAD(+) diphosphatase [Pseudomarimonas salicorniae]|uniref:NAD(+) diphosphatase n=1 Tax=Pseudomarimonas salicorniae TaxID=2933270 RepID=A0ABT0GCD8_9GAMM|nr:NAD(+) diphosphatase [Lysobacter sp. CAU 1642]MCK7592206.1 NAD(+) diphosphatase [Lysobacter sp. CAU 1642]